MTVTKILENLDNTIAGKELLLARYNSSKTATDWIIADFLSINIAELKRIREDVVQCIKEEV